MRDIGINLLSYRIKLNITKHCFSMSTPLSNSLRMTTASMFKKFCVRHFSQNCVKLARLDLIFLDNHGVFAFHVLEFDTKKSVIRSQGAYQFAPPILTSDWNLNKFLYSLATKPCFWQKSKYSSCHVWYLLLFEFCINPPFFIKFFDNLPWF